MKIDGINPQPLMDIIDQSTGERGIVGYLLNIQTIENNMFTGVINAPVTVAEYNEYSKKLKALAEKKITELFKLEISEVDRFDLEYYKKELEKEKAKTSSLENGLMELTLMYTNEVV